MAKGIVAKNEVEKEKAAKGKWILNVLFLILGAAIGFLSNYFNDFIKDNQTRNELTNMICIEVQNNTTTIDEFLRVFPQEKTKEKVDISEVVINATNYDTRVFEAYIHKIPLLPMETARVILAFYGDLIKANDTLHKFQDNDLRQRETWFAFYYQKLEGASEKGKYIINHFKEQDKDYPLGDKNVPDIVRPQVFSTGTSTISYPNVPLTPITIDANDN